MVWLSYLAFSFVVNCKDFKPENSDKQNVGKQIILLILTANSTSSNNEVWKKEYESF